MQDSDQKAAAGAALTIIIKVRDKNNNEMEFKVKRSILLHKVREAWCNKMSPGVDPITRRLASDGRFIGPEDTPESVEDLFQIKYPNEAN